MSALEHVHADPGAIDAALAWPRPPGVPLDLWLEALADKHDGPTPPHSGRPNGTTRST